MYSTRQSKLFSRAIDRKFSDFRTDTAYSGVCNNRLCGYYQSETEFRKKK